MEVKFTMEQVEALLNKQKEIVVEKLSGQSSSYNSENTNSVISSLPIDKNKMMRIGMEARFPHDIEILKKYL